MFTQQSKRFFVALIMFLALSGCGSNPAVVNPTIDLLATDVGYGVYRAVPDARPILSSACLIKDFSNPELAAESLKRALEVIWTDASKMTSQDAQLAILTINNLNGLLQIQLANADAQRASEILKLVYGSICKGVDLAAPK